MFESREDKADNASRLLLISMKYFTNKLTCCSQQSVRRAERDISVAVSLLGVLGAGQLQQERAPAKRAPARAHLAGSHLSGSDIC